MQPPRCRQHNLKSNRSRTKESNIWTESYLCNGHESRDSNPGGAANGLQMKRPAPNSQRRSLRLNYRCVCVSSRREEFRRSLTVTFECPTSTSLAPFHGPRWHTSGIQMLTPARWGVPLAETQKHGRPWRKAEAEKAPLLFYPVGLASRPQTADLNYTSEPQHVLALTVKQATPQLLKLAGGTEAASGLEFTSKTYSKASHTHTHTQLHCMVMCKHFAHLLLFIIVLKSSLNGKALLSGFLFFFFGRVVCTYLTLPPPPLSNVSPLFPPADKSKWNGSFHPSYLGQAVEIRLALWRDGEEGLLTYKNPAR